MKAYVTSVGEVSTDLCKWALERNGFEVYVIRQESSTMALGSLAEKLQYIYNTAEEDFLRVDADIVVNKHLTPDFLEALTKLNGEIWWWQFLAFDWYKQDIAHCLSYIRQPALPALRAKIPEYLDNIRPETEMSRIPEFYNPRRFETFDDRIVGLHGFGIKDLKPVRKLKAQRGQTHLYDFELAERLNDLR